MTKTLQLARSFHTAGHRVILFDIDKYLSGYRFSNAVAGFYTVPDPERRRRLHNSSRAIAKQEKHRPFIPRYFRQKLL